jgi:hypothetical protein
MFPRKKKNRTGTISVVVVDKSRCPYLPAIEQVSDSRLSEVSNPPYERKVIQI